MGDVTLLGWFLLAIAAGVSVWVLASTWAALHVSGSAGRMADAMMLLAGGEAADGDDYTYPQRREKLYDVRTFTERTDERFETLEDEILQLEEAVRKLLVRLEALEAKSS